MSIRIALVVTALAFPAAAGAATVDVDIRDFEYQPASVTIAVNDTVRWTNRGAFTHTATSDTPGQFDSGDLITNAQFPHTFMTPGTFAYHCFYHPTMTGTVTVVAPGTPLPPPELRVGDRRVREGDGGFRSAVFVVRLSQASSTLVEVMFGTANGTARRRSDYRARSGTVTFAPGQTVKRVAVRVVADLRDERRETFWLLLHDPTGATLADHRGRGLIVDDD
ncbi:MAG: Calx-beta domain-containing protein [Gaiellales bacterium]